MTAKYTNIVVIYRNGKLFFIKNINYNLSKNKGPDTLGYMSEFVVSPSKRRGTKVCRIDKSRNPHVLAKDSYYDIDYILKSVGCK